jgi:hypothetical protein
VAGVELLAAVVAVVIAQAQANLLLLELLIL